MNMQHEEWKYLSVDEQKQVKDIKRKISENLYAWKSDNINLILEYFLNCGKDRTDIVCDVNRGSVNPLFLFVKNVDIYIAL